MSFNTYYSHAKIQIREDMRYFWSEAFWNGAITTFYACLLILFYEAAGTGPLNSFTWSSLVWYLLAAQFNSAYSSMFVRTLTLQIRSGEIISKLSRPVNYVFASFAEHVGTILPTSIARLGFMIPLGIALVGTSAISGLGIFMFFIGFCLAIIIDFVISLCLGLIAFWTEDARPYRWIYSKTVFLIGGLFFPLEIYPEALRNIVVWLPPAFLAYHPATMLVQPTAANITVAVVGALMWIGILSIIARFVYKTAIKKVEVNGG